MPGDIDQVRIAAAVLLEPALSDLTWEMVAELLDKRAAWDATQPPPPPSEPEEPIVPRHPCGCRISAGSRIVDEGKHAAWHELVVAQGGPVGEVSLNTLRAARGMQTVSLSSETILDSRARDSGKRASGECRRAAHAA